METNSAKKTTLSLASLAVLSRLSRARLILALVSLQARQRLSHLHQRRHNRNRWLTPALAQLLPPTPWEAQLRSSASAQVLQRREAI